jgi:hypothetical protein
MLLLVIAHNVPFTPGKKVQPAIGPVMRLASTIAARH